MACVPLRGGRLSGVVEARRQAGRYAEAAKTLAEETANQLTPDDRKQVNLSTIKMCSSKRDCVQVKWQGQAMFQWLRSTGPSAPFEELINRLAFLKTQCGPILVKASKPAVSALSEKLHAAAREAADQLQVI